MSMTDETALVAGDAAGMARALRKENGLDLLAKVLEVPRGRLHRQEPEGEEHRGPDPAGMGITGTEVSVKHPCRS